MSPDEQMICTTYLFNDWKLKNEFERRWSLGIDVASHTNEIEI